MGFKAFRTLAFSHSHENYAFNLLYENLKKQWEKHPEPLYLLGNFYVDGCEIDALIIKRNAIIVVDFKDYGGQLTFSENSSWKIGKTEVRGGTKPNPYLQIRNNKFSILNYIKNKITLNTSPELGHIAGICLFQQKIAFDRSELPINVSRWFHISDMDSIVKIVDCIASPKINLNQLDFDLILKTFDIPQYFPDGEAIEVQLPCIDAIDTLEVYLNSEQEKATEAIDIWLSHNQNSAISIAGSLSSGKIKILKWTIDKIISINKTPIIIVPNARISARYENKGILETKSIYSWLYSSSYSTKDGNMKLYPIKRNDINTEKDILVFLEAHFLGDDYFALDTAVYGTGHILSDMLKSFCGSDANSQDEALNTPKMIIFGDPFQILRGSKNKNLLFGNIFQEYNIPFKYVLLESQDRSDDTINEILDFQIEIIGQMKTSRFIQLPLCQEKQIKTLQKGAQTSSIVNELLSWPRNTIYLCATNDTVNNVNKFVRQTKPRTPPSQNLTAGDIVDLHNRTIALVGDGGLSKDSQWINPGELAYVEWVSQPEIHEVSLKGRNNKISIKTAKARIKRENGTSDILFLPDYLFAEKPEISSDQMIALKVLAREDAAKQLIEKRRELDFLEERIHSKNALPTDEDKIRYEKEKQNYKLELDMLTTQSPYFNIAKLRFGYAMTVHRAQTYAPFSKVILNCSPYTEFENTETDTYFRRLYTATTCTTENLFLLNYPRKSIFHKTKWNCESCKISPVIFKQKIYYHVCEEFSNTSEEFKVVFENSPKELKSFFIYIDEK